MNKDFLEMFDEFKFHQIELKYFSMGNVQYELVPIAEEYVITVQSRTPRLIGGIWFVGGFPFKIKQINKIRNSIQNFICGDDWLPTYEFILVPIEKELKNVRTFIKLLLTKWINDFLIENYKYS